MYKGNSQKHQLEVAPLFNPLFNSLPNCLKSSNLFPVARLITMSSEVFHEKLRGKDFVYAGLSHSTWSWVQLMRGVGANPKSFTLSTIGIPKPTNPPPALAIKKR